MTDQTGGAGVARGVAEKWSVPLTFGVGVGSSALVAIALAVTGSSMVTALCAAAGLLAYDPFRLPRTAPRELPGGANMSALLEKQAALQRVATLVARRVAPDEVFAAVAREAGLLLGVDAVHIGRYERDDTMAIVASWGRTAEHVPVGMRVATADMLRELGVRSTVGAPIVVGESLWGVICASSKDDKRLPVDTESKLAAFTELVAPAMSSVQARAETGRLVDQLVALRRVARLVTRVSSPVEVFAAATEEVGRLLDVEDTTLIRYELDGTATVVASWGGLDTAIAVGERWSLAGENVSAAVRRTGLPARIDDYADPAGPRAAFLRTRGIRSAVAAPVVVDGRLWGAMIAASQRAQPLPASTESRIGEFTELVATAISNIEARSELAASRARIVAATDEERRRVVRDLHDGAQQRLVHTVMTLKLAREAVHGEPDRCAALVTEALENAEQATVELRELAHGILPGVLTHGGLRAGVQALASRMPVPVDNGVAVGRLPDALEATAYFVVAEALTNVAKHARARRAAVTARIEDGKLAVRVRDDGVGGARRDGSGLLGLADRLAVLDGQLRVESPAGGGTLVAAAIPLPRP
jgi:signal transduction histidine kinase